MSGLFALAISMVIVAVIRLMQGWRIQFANGNADDWYRPGIWPGFRDCHFAACFVLIPAIVYFSTFIPLYGLSLPDILIYYYLPSATIASLALVYALTRGNNLRWPLWIFVAIAFAGFAAMLPISAGFVGTSTENFNRLMIFQSWI